ncbi:MAG: aromatic-ring-hydroxylating dioxygenase subunit beta [Ilumatobacteraceae bacterium]
MTETTSRLISRATAEDFLFAEAALLEAGEFTAWLALFEPGGRYQIPTTDAPADAMPESTQFFIADDWDLLQARVTRLLSKNAHAENPRSKTHRMITNVRVGPADNAAGDDAQRVQAAFVIHRIRDGRIDQYLGRFDHIVAVSEAGLHYRLRKSILAAEQLRPGGRLSFIV